MKFVDIINSKMFLNGLMEIVAKKDRAITLKLDNREVVDVDIFFDTKCIQIVLMVEKDEYNEKFRFKLIGNELHMETHPSKTDELQLKAFKWCLQYANDYECSFNQFIGAY